ncbi:ER membrane protein complex subunit 9 isoform X5 [Rhinolophus sinicus]|uniref:ER membrane protein complex subunit 9 isoform X5 n=1 Tax=Rhinolophus sinicus TaxID=89399 RepID=UPI003D7A893A
MPVPHRLCAPVPQPPGPVCHAGGRPQPGGCVGRAGRSGSGWVLPRQCSSERPEWLSTCFPQHSSIKQLCMKHQAGLTPLPWPRSATGEAITAPMSETWEAQLRWMGSAHSPLLMPLIFPLHSPGPLALKIAGRIAEFFPDAVLIMLDNQKLVPQSHVPPVIVLENHGARWVPKDKNLVMWRDWEESRQMVGALLEGRAYQHLVDFDCHLDDIRQDWTNQQLNTRITQWVGPSNGNV